ncbi:GNAT family N-acetyltransferase [Actinoplanes sp. NPDC026619]|uniref:GNAT family N-acetyltransferase n=1 Tax=Actinoplanes sp. NPDC026619 TaxID=3155798 RepID=UPI0033C5978A
MKPRDYSGPADLAAMQRIVQRAWNPDSHWHIGDLAWQRPSMPDRTIALWDEAAWAWFSAGNGLEMAAPPELVGAVLAWFDEMAGDDEKSVTVMETDAAAIDGLTAAGYRPAQTTTFFRHCLRELDDTLPAPQITAGYQVRSVRPGELAARAAVHRAAWQLKRLGEMQVPPVDLGEGGSGMTTARYGEIIGHWPYRSDLDLVVEAPDGSLVGSALGWIDDVNHVALLEPVGVDPEHGRRGLGAAVSLACLHAMRAAGATLAVVCPRGDDAYPVPRRLYHAVGFHDAGRTVTYQR